MRPLIVAVAVLLGLASAASAVPVQYALSTEASSVGFETDFGPDKITGQMPVSQADLTLDFADVARSQIDVTLDVSHASASFPFAAQAMMGPKVLDAENHPRMVFHSTAVRQDGDGARVQGDLTIRGVTKPVTLQARFWRKAGTAADDLSHLTIQLTGKVNRSDFGALGWADMVGDEVRIIILARIAETG